MNDKELVIKCCICGSVKTKDGWRFCAEPMKRETAYSHGFCTSCHETELMKVKLRTLAGARVLSA